MEDIHGSGNTASNINSNEVGIIQFPPLSSDSEGGGDEHSFIRK